MHCRGEYGKLPPSYVRTIFFLHATRWIYISVPIDLVKLWDELNVRFPLINFKVSTFFYSTHIGNIQNGLFSDSSIFRVAHQI